MDSTSATGLSFENGGYKLQDDYPDVVEKADPADIEALKVLMSEGMRVCEDPQVVKRGRKLLELMGIASPEGGRQQPDGIEIIPKGAGIAHPGGTVTIGHSSKPDIINPILTSETISVNLMVRF